MTLAASGYIDMKGGTAGRSIQTELGSSGSISLRDANVLALAGRTGLSVTMPDDFWGKSSYTPSMLVDQGTAGTYSLTIPSGCSVVWLMVVGGGGGGGGGACGSIGPYYYRGEPAGFSGAGGGGGGGGQVVTISSFAVTAGQTISYTVGAGGTGRNALGHAGGTGEASSASYSGGGSVSAAGGTAGEYYAIKTSGTPLPNGNKSGPGGTSGSGYAGGTGGADAIDDAYGGGGGGDSAVGVSFASSSYTCDGGAGTSVTLNYNSGALEKNQVISQGNQWGTFGRGGNGGFMVAYNPAASTAGTGNGGGGGNALAAWGNVSYAHGAAGASGRVMIYG